MFDIDTERYSRVPRESRKCIYCDMDHIGNEFHFVCICTIHGVEKYTSCADPGIIVGGGGWGGVQARLLENRSDGFF